MQALLLPLILFPTHELLQYAYSLLQRLQPRFKLLLDSLLIVTQLRIEIISVAKIKSANISPRHVSVFEQLISTYGVADMAALKIGFTRKL
jgi:hypothetical protein